MTYQPGKIEVECVGGPKDGMRVMVNTRDWSFLSEEELEKEAKRPPSHVYVLRGNKLVYEGFR